MMDSANCSPVQVAGTCQKIPPPTTSLPVRMAVVCQHTKSEPGDVRRLQPGWAVALAARLRSAIPLGCEGLDRRPALKPPRGAKAQQQPLRHRCSSPARLGDEWDFDIHHTVFAVGRSLVSEFRMSRMFTTLNVGRWFFRSLSKLDYMLCLLWFGLFSILSVIMSGDFFFISIKRKNQ